uniref:Ribosomal protein L7Ae/L30e/S12e/Gadd45 n=1 Tax=Tanacetum cinerariifolium TaxID=118510 RepID=A0A6L2MUI7_TANCI|nr:ribosomal protein L7Ae/L30e/S12e/Gadd45 [Tanacetum cinerariifolium]
MSTLKFADTHNVVAFLSKPTESDGFELIVDFLNAHPIRRDLQLADEEGIDYLPNSTIFEQLALMGEAVHKKLSDSLVRAATTASSLGVEQDSGNITKTQSKATPNESSSQGTNSGGGPKCQETIGDTTAQTRVESSGDEKSLGEDASKQGRRIDAIDANEDITRVNDADKEIFDMDDLGGEEVFVVGKNENVVEEVVNTAQVSTVATTVTITTKEITLAQAHEALKTSKPKVKEIVFQEPGYKLKDLKLKEFDSIQEMFDKAFKRVNTFEDFKTELVEGKEKRAGIELEQEITKKQKVEDDKEKAKLKQLLETILDEEEVSIDDIPLAVKSPTIVINMPRATVGDTSLIRSYILEVSQTLTEQQYNLAYFFVKRIESARATPKAHLPYGMFLTRLFRHVMEHYPYLDNGIYDVIERVMRPLALRQTHRPRSDCGKARHSVSSTFANHNCRSSSYQGDDDEDDRASRTSTPSPTTYLNSLRPLEYQQYDVPTSSEQNDDLLFELQTDLLNQTQQMHKELNGGFKSFGKALFVSASLVVFFSPSAGEAVAWPAEGTSLVILEQAKLETPMGVPIEYSSV